MGSVQATPALTRPAAVDRITFRGHALVSSLHPTTIEVTTEERLTRNGDCIIGVGADKGCAQLDEGLKSALRHGSSKVWLKIVVGSESFRLTAVGDLGLGLSHPNDAVIRKSRFLSDRTLAVGASAAARDIPRSMVAKLRDPRTKGALEIEVRTA